MTETQLQQIALRTAKIAKRQQLEKTVATLKHREEKLREQMLMP